VHDLRDGRLVGPGWRAPTTDFARTRLARDGRAALFVDDESRQMHVYTVADGRRTLVRPFRVNDPAVAFSPGGDRVAIRVGADGFRGLVEVREVASGRLVSSPLPTPTWAKRLEFSGDGRRLVVEAGPAIRLLDVDLGLPLGPWISFADSGLMQTELPSRDACLAADGHTVLTRAKWHDGGYLRASRFQVWNIGPDARPIEELGALAELHAGRRLAQTGEVVPLSPGEYQARWRDAKARHAGWLAPHAPDAPETVPAAPTIPKEVALERPKPPRPEQRRDYIAVLRRFADPARPPFASLAEALDDKDPGIRRAAVDGTLALGPGTPFALAMLTEAMKDPAVRERAIDRLGSMGPEAAPAVPVLIAELGLIKKHEPFGAEAAVARALGRIGPAAVSAVPALRELIDSIPRHHYNDVDVEAARALGRIGPAARPAIPGLVPLLLKYSASTSDGDPVVVRAIERVAAGAEGELVPQFVLALRKTPADARVNPSIDPRIGVVEMISRLGPRARGIEPALRAVLAENADKPESDDLLRVRAAEALWLVSGRADDALTVLVDALADDGKPSAGARRAFAAAALGRIGPPAGAAVPTLRAMLARPSTGLERLEAASALWRLTGDAKPVLPLLVEVLGTKLEGSRGDRGGPVRAIAIMKEMGDAAKDAAPALAAAIRAEDAFNAASTFRVRILKPDEEDDDPDESELIRRNGLPVLRQLDPAAAAALATPAKTP
jgi:hypothetical protein